MSKTTELLQNHFVELQKKYQQLLSKVDPNLLHLSSIVVPSIPTKTKNERSLVEYLSLVTGLFIANKKS